MPNTRKKRAHLPQKTAGSGQTKIHKSEKAVANVNKQSPTVTKSKKITENKASLDDTKRMGKSTTMQRKCKAKLKENMDTPVLTDQDVVELHPNQDMDDAQVIEAEFSEDGRKIRMEVDQGNTSINERSENEPLQSFEGEIDEDSEEDMPSLNSDDQFSSDDEVFKSHRFHRNTVRNKSPGKVGRTYGRDSSHQERIDAIDEEMEEKI